MKRLVKILRALMPNCQAAIRLQSEALDRPLPRTQRLGLRLHLFLCVWCSRYAKQIKFLRAAAQRCDPDQVPQPTLPAEARERIKHALEAGQRPQG